MKEKFQANESTTVVVIDLGAGAAARVKAEEMITKGEVLGEKLPDRAEYDLVKVLGVKADKATKLLKKQVGDEVRPGDLLAEKKGWLTAKKLKSQVAGKVIAGEKGKLTVEISGTGHEIVSMVTGKVVKADNGAVEVDIRGEELIADWGWGPQVWGKLWLLGASDGQELSIESVRGDLKNLVVVLGVVLNKGLWHKLCTLGIKGLICPGVPEDFDQWMATDDDEEVEGLAGRQKQAVVVMGSKQAGLGKDVGEESENKVKTDKENKDGEDNKEEPHSEAVKEQSSGEVPQNTVLAPELWEWFNKRVGRVAVVNGHEKKVLVSKE